MTEAPRVVVVGGGVSGLAAGYIVQSLVPQAKVIVIDAAMQTGGKLRVGEIAAQPIDLGAESLLNRRPEAAELAREVGLTDEIVYPVTTTAGIWSRGEVRSLPRTVMGVPADLAALQASGIVGRRAIPRTRVDRLLPKVDVTEDVAIGDLVGRRLGGEIRDRLVEPMLGGVYAGRSEDLSLHATVPQLVPALTEHGGLLAAAAALVATPTSAEPTAAPPVFAGIRGGIGRLPVAIEAAIGRRGGLVRNSTTVREISRTETGFRLVLGPTIAPETLDAEVLVLAVPAAPASRLLRETAPRAATELAAIQYSSMAIVSAAFRAAEVGAPLEGSGFLVPPVDGHLIKAVTYSSRKWGWLSPDLLIVRCSVGRVGDEASLQRDDSELVQAALLDLREAVGVEARLVDAQVTRWGGALPQYAVGHLDRVRRIREAVDAVPGLAVCGAAYDGVGIAACIASARLAATRVGSYLSRRETMQS